MQKASATLSTARHCQAPAPLFAAPEPAFFRWSEAHFFGMLVEIR